MIDVKALKPFPSWGVPIFDELVAVVGQGGIKISYRVAVCEGVPRREAGHVKSKRFSGARQEVCTGKAGFDPESEHFS